MEPTTSHAELKTMPAAPNTRPLVRIVVPVQGSDAEFVAQQWAIEFAAALTLPVTAIHVAEPGRDAPADVFQFMDGIAKKWGVKLRSQVLESASPITEFLKELGPRDLVVVGTARLAKHYRVGSFAGELIRAAPCPIQVVRIQ
ncbi:MAG: universal stress protein [Euryarchaeota archaeon]|nr:universal stress protein [Euryarchaeota archaeon]